MGSSPEDAWRCTRAPRRTGSTSVTLARERSLPNVEAVLAVDGDLGLKTRSIDLALVSSMLEVDMANSTISAAESISTAVKIADRIASP